MFHLLTPRLHLRPLRPADAPALAAYRSDPAVARYQSWPLPFTLEHAQRMVAEMENRVPGDPGWVQIGLEVRSGGALLGDLAINTDQERVQAELGFTLSASAQGQGYAHEALGALLAHAFGPLGLHRLHAGLDPRNEASARLLTRLGFRHEGTALESYWQRGEWTDDARYALLSREWMA